MNDKTRGDSATDQLTANGMPPTFNQRVDRLLDFAATLRRDLLLDKRTQEARKVGELVTYVRTLRTSTNDISRRFALGAIEVATLVGALFATRPIVIEGIIQEVGKYRTRSAHTSHNEIQEIIKRRARRLWAREPILESNSRKTAERICEAVNREIFKLPSVPKRWRVKNVKSGKRRELAIGRIRKRIDRIQ